MNKNILSFMLICLSLFINTVLYAAGRPLWTFTPLTDTTMSVKVNQTLIVQYRVTNQSRISHTLIMVPITGITQNTTSGNCPDPFSLSPGSSCILSLEINGNELNGNISGGPIVCQQSPVGTPNPLQCYQPSPSSILNIQRSSSASYIYISNFGDFNGTTVSRCTLDSVNGALTNCITFDGFSVPYGVAINNGYAYVSNGNIDSVSKCTIASVTGDLLNCAATGSGFGAPSGIAFYNGYAYITNFSLNAISKCNIDSNGELFSCIYTGSALSLPEGGIVIYNNYAYISNRGDNNVLKCTVNSTNGELFDCNQTGSGFDLPIALARNNNELYVTNFNNNTISKCQIASATGELFNCFIAGIGFDGPGGLGIWGNYAYVGNFNSNILSRCLIDPLTGTLSSCISTGSGFFRPEGSFAFL